MRTMVTGEAHYLSIGQFATAAGLTTKALRLYHDLHLLVPAYVDPWTKYRYYKTEQIAKARLIRIMRQADMSIEGIKQALAQPTTESLLDVVEAHVAERARHLQMTREAATQLRLILTQETSMSFQVKSKTIEPMRVVTETSHLRVDQLDSYITETVKKLGAKITEQDGKPAGPAFGIFHGPINNEDDGPLQVAIPVDNAITTAAGVEVNELPGGQFAVAEARGVETVYPEILGAYDAVAMWIRSQGKEMVGSPREVWHELLGPKAHLEIMWQYK
jgi:DNA-binding transcriptional MerR regulator